MNKRQQTDNTLADDVPSPRYIFGSLTRISDLERRPFNVSRLPDKAKWDTGDYVVARYQSPLSYARAGPTEKNFFCELPTGRHQYYEPGDVVVGALGARRATQELCGDWRAVETPNSRVVDKENLHDGDGGVSEESIFLDDLDGAGLFGKVTSLSPHFPSHPRNFEYLGHVTRNGKKQTMMDFVSPKMTASQPPDVPTILVIGTSMSCGKTFTARTFIHATKQQYQGTRVVACKMTGAGYLSDILAFQDSGAEAVFDFVDAGLPSTIVDENQYRSSIKTLFGLMHDHRPDLLMVELGASPIEPYNGELALKAFSQQRLQHHRKSKLFVILCASDVFSVCGAMSFLEGYDIRPSLIAGMVANTSAGREMVEELTGIPASSLNSDDEIAKYTEWIQEAIKKS